MCARVCFFPLANHCITDGASLVVVAGSSGMHETESVAGPGDPEDKLRPLPRVSALQYGTNSNVSFQ